MSNLIERLKQEIAYKATYCGVPFDHEDIEAHETYDGHWLVALMWIKVPYIDDQLIEHGTKTANIWLDPPPRQLVKFTPTDDPFVYSISCFVPRLHVRYPQLVYVILPDGTIKTDSADFMAGWFDKEAKRQAAEDMEWAVRQTKNRLP